MENDTTDKEEDVIGREYITKVEANYCTVCRDFLLTRRNDDERAIVDHCKSSRHINRYHDCKRDEERKAKRSAKESANDNEATIEKTIPNQNGSEVKIEKIQIDEVDRDADVNLDENTNGSENPDGN